MRKVECVVIGGGPAGLMATKSLLDAGVWVTLIERSSQLGGQLNKQTHKFFGSESQYAKVRGFDIAKELIKQIENHPNLDLLLNTHVVALYQPNIVSTYDLKSYQAIEADKIILATGASEKFLAFENNDCPQIMGAGAIQTLMNLHGVLPGQEVVMIGSGNIGLIVSYQLIQAGVKVKAIVEASDSIGGYGVHASKLKRLGVPFIMNSTIKRAIGEEALEAVEIIHLNDQSSEIINCDVCCIAVGLSPLYQLAGMLGVATTYISELGGEVVVIDDTFKSSHPDLYVAGDASGIEEASAAMMEGALCGLFVALSLNKEVDLEMIKSYQLELEQLRNGPFGHKIKAGHRKMRERAYVK